MNRSLVVAVGLLAMATPGLAQRTRAPAPSPLTPALSAVRSEVLDATVSFLGDSLLRGRVPGTNGGVLAARFIASHFQTLGLAPAGANGTFLQAVPLMRVRAKASAVFGAGRETFTPKSPDDLVLWPLTTDSLISMDGEMVFAGYGIEAPEFGWDDYKGVPQAGRIVLVLAGDPGVQDSAVYGGRMRPRFGNWNYKLEQAAKMGAAGVLIVHSASATGSPWLRLAAPLAGDHLWLAPGPARTSLKFAGWIREDVARALLKAAGRDYQLLLRRAQQKEFSPVNTGIHAAFDIDTDISRTQGLNIVARLEGADSTARGEPVILAAPYVRFDSDAGFWRDSGSTSADEVMGVANLLATAAGAVRLTSPPRRPLLFVASAGRPGAEQFVGQLRDRAVSVIHFEGAPSKTVAGQTVAGLDRSSLEEVVRSAAQADGVVLDTDGGSEASFVASGAYTYAAGLAPVIDLRPDGSPKTPRLALRIAWAVANSSQFPAWLPGMEPVSARRRGNQR